MHFLVVAPAEEIYIQIMYLLTYPTQALNYPCVIEAVCQTFFEHVE